MDTMVLLMSDPANWAALLTLIVMEVVLGIDNLLFISIITNKLPEAQRRRARNLGIGLALFMRLFLLAGIAWIVGLVEPVFALFDHSFSWKDIILIAGGTFLVWKATKEIHHHVDPDPEGDMMVGKAVTMTLGAAIVQILVLDLVFSIDSIITAVGMTPHVPIMVVAVIFAVTCMLLLASPLSAFINKNPTVVMLALGFLLMIGTTLVAEGFHVKIPKGYIYAAMAFAGLIEGLNLLARRRKTKGT
ncbi:Membrane protein TerC, possibly involved in tellurium resistance [Monaibacterium marinum]|uniref:Membrane protein TerC, possibly involved in tellurium resistance n=1 Tax=Pontivivens marinum TaxID=1690039 RepID=A0A2C9CMX9_9RHOB|nr:TerC family protein [Monaibacterium marinum]SOH92555.1 Membrane protein TerC, possibly involved in tellurium resistance [Monaibacterium marinum]